MGQASSSKSGSRRPDFPPRLAELRQGGAESVQGAECLASIICPDCNNIADEIIFAQGKQRAGWYCGICHHFEKAIGRERLL